MQNVPIGRTHNVLIHEELGYAVSVSLVLCSSTCHIGYIVIDVNDIINTTSPVVHVKIVRFITLIVSCTAALEDDPMGDSIGA